MLNVKIWIRNPYPFRFSEYEALQDSINRTYGVKSMYFREFPVDFLEVENTTITTAKQIALTLRTVHRHWAIMDKQTGSRVNAENVETEVRGRLDGRPAWAS
jgi:hypothetical protein